jgi:hypothetical protein
MLLVGAFILVVIVGIIIAGAHQAFKAHVRRYGLLPVLWRYISGRQRHGLEGDDRRRDDKYDPHSKHYDRWARIRKGVQRSGWTMLIPLAVMAWVVRQSWFTSHFHLIHQNRLDLTVVLLVLILIGDLVWSLKGLRRNKGNTKRIVTPLHRALAPEVGVPLAARPGQWIRMSEDRTNVRFDLPKNFHPSEGQRNRMTSMIRDIAGMQGDSVLTFNVEGNNSYAEMKSANPPPEKVFLKDVYQAIDKSSQDNVVLGLGRGNDTVKVSVAEDSPHFGLSIAAGGGKSQLARLAAAQILHNGGIVLILDIKRLSHTWARDLPNVRYARTIEEIHDALIWLDYEINRRTRVADVGVDLEGEVHANVGPRVLVIAEELNEGMARLRRYWIETRGRNDPKKSPAIEALEEALFMGRQVRINMFAVAQMMTALAAGSGAARENMGIRILGRYTRNAWRMLVPEHEMPPRSMKPGRVQVVTNKVTECQVAFLTGAEARELASNGEVTPFPTVPEGLLDGRSPSPVSPVITGEIVSGDVVNDVNVREVTLAEAVALCPGKTLSALRNMRDRHKKNPEVKFPDPVGHRGNGPKAPETYRETDILRWYRSA